MASVSALSSPVQVYVPQQLVAVAVVKPIVVAATPAELRAKLVEAAAEAVNMQLDKIFDTEISAMKAEYESNGKKIPEGANVYSIAGRYSMLMRPAHLISTHSRATLEKDVASLSKAQTNCYAAILTACIDKISKLDKYFSLGLRMGLIEREIQKGSDFTKSKLLCSKVYAVSLTCKGDKLKLFE